MRRSPADFGGAPGVCDTYGAEGTAGGGFPVYVGRGLAWDAGSPALNGRRRRVAAGGGVSVRDVCAGPARSAAGKDECACAARGVRAGRRRRRAPRGGCW